MPGDDPGPGGVERNRQERGQRPPRRRRPAPQEDSPQQTRGAGLRAGTQPASAWGVKAVDTDGRGLGRGELCLSTSFFSVKGVPRAPKPGVRATMPGSLQVSLVAPPEAPLCPFHVGGLSGGKS